MDRVLEHCPAGLRFFKGVELGQAVQNPAAAREFMFQKDQEPSPGPVAVPLYTDRNRHVLTAP